MKKICLPNITSIMLILVSKATCDYYDSGSEYYYDDGSHYPDSMVYSGSFYDKQPWILNLKGSLRQHMALNGAIADSRKSFVCSPISALLPLGQLVLGASGTCKTQLYNAVGVYSTSDLKSSFKSLMRAFSSPSGIKLNICNRLYVSNKFELKPEFRENAKGVFRSRLKLVDFNKPESVAGKINNWVKQRTKGMIKEIIKPNDISPNSVMILINTVYFSANWKTTFPSARMQDFYTATSTRKVPMMTRDGTYNYAKIDVLDCQIIEIPYTGGQASFIIFLPNTRDGLSVLLYKLKLAPELMQDALDEMKMKQVVLSIPKFKTTSDLDLKVSYQKLGLTDIFKTERSGLNDIVKGKKELHVSKAIQKAVIEVNEYGTKAAAVSLPRSKAGKNRDKICLDTLTAAVWEVENGSSVRKAAEKFKIPKSTIFKNIKLNHCQNIGEEGLELLKNDVRRIFSDTEEQQIYDYLKKQHYYTQHILLLTMEAF